MIQCGFFNAVRQPDGTYDRTYDADAFNEFFNGILTDTGVYKKSGNAMKVVPNTGMTVNISTGKARILQHWAHIPVEESITLPASHLTLNKYVAIVLRYSVADRTIIPMYIEGTTATTPVRPSILRTASTYDICLAYIYVKAGATTITASDIEDTREAVDLCGYVKLQIDSINAGIKEYRNVVTTTANGTTQIAIGIPEFDADNDLIFANINGVMFVRDTDYTINGTGSSAKIVLVNDIQANNTVEFRVIKSVIEVL